MRQREKRLIFGGCLVFTAFIFLLHLTSEEDSLSADGTALVLQRAEPSSNLVDEIGNENIQKSELDFEVERALLDLRALKCIPKQCAQPTAFLPKDLTRSKFALVSVPGSGNTMIRKILEAATKVFTGSFYRDSNLVKAGFQGEKLPPQDTRTVFVKSHFPANPGYPLPVEFVVGFFHIVRAPLHAHLADCNRYYGKGHKQRLSLDEQRRKCVEYAEKKSRGWRKMMRFYEHATETPLAKRKGFVHLDRLDKGGQPVITMFYEDFIRDLPRATAYLVAALRQQLPEYFSSVTNATACVLADRRGIEKGRRKQSGGSKTNVFGRNSSLVTRLCSERYAEFWNENKWGDCIGQLEHSVEPRDDEWALPSTICEE